MIIRFKHKGDLKATEWFLKRVARGSWKKRVEALAQKGVDALAEATPKDTGLTASSWHYEIVQDTGALHVYWVNDNMTSNPNIPGIALLIQYGHGTGTGGYVQGRDYINPALRPIFDEIADDVWREVTKG